MPSTSEIISKLWTEQRVVFATDYDEEFFALFSRPAGFFDVVIGKGTEPLGFITLKNEAPGLYSIVNDVAGNPHPGFVNTPGHGLEVKKGQRKKGLGAALLTLAIGLAQQHYKISRPVAPFRVVATDITAAGLGCYRSFGFQVRQGLKISAGEYTDAEMVPELAIRPWKMPLALRLIRRLR